MAKISRTITVDIQQTPSNLYGLHYFEGDLVSVDIGTETVIMQVNQVTLGYDFNRTETVKVQLEIDN